MNDRSRRPASLRALLFLYSNANIGGCLSALLGPALLFGGVIGPGWMWITAGLYGVGALGGTLLRRTPEVERQIEATLTLDEILQHLDRVIAEVTPEVGREILTHLASLRSAIAEVLPRLLELSGDHGDLYTVRETVLRYLPETLANYVALPPAFRSAHVLRDGKTARQLLAEQIALLDARMQDIVANVASADAQALLANGEFLRTKFDSADFLPR